MDLSDIKLPEIPKVFQEDLPDLLAFIDRRLEPDMADLLPRGDYKEFLELAKVFLGGSVGRKKATPTPSKFLELTTTPDGCLKQSTS